jgi:hypothetical protein
MLSYIFLSLFRAILQIMWWQEILAQRAQELQSKAEDGNLTRRDRFLVNVLFQMYIVFVRIDELFWQLEKLWYRLDTFIFPLPKSDKNEAMDDYYLRIPKRLALRELWFTYQKYKRKLDKVDPQSAVAAYSRKRDKQAIKKLIQCLETIRDDTYELYWKVRLAE